MIKDVINFNRKVTLSKIRYEDVNKKLDNLSRNIKKYQQKGLTKYLINKNSILNGEIYFFSDKLQNYLV